jgi:flagellar biosynthesis chaperone FliJ
MKKIMIFAAFLIGFTACTNVEKFRPEVESISEDWTKTELMITELATSVGMSQNALIEKVQELNIGDVIFQKIPQEKRDELQAAQGEIMSVVEEYNGVLGEINQFGNEWGAKTEKLEALKAGLDAKKIEGNPAAQISELKNTLDMANNNLTNWMDKVEALKFKGASKIGVLESLMESYQ